MRKDREAIIVTEIPYQVNKARMIERIAELVREKIIEGISDLRDESDRDGVRVVIELKRDAMADVVLNQLYRYTPLQTSFGVNMLALDGGRPQLMTSEATSSPPSSPSARKWSRGARSISCGKARERAHILARPRRRRRQYRRGDRAHPRRRRSRGRARRADGARLAGRRRARR